MEHVFPGHISLFPRRFHIFRRRQASFVYALYVEVIGLGLFTFIAPSRGLEVRGAESDAIELGI